MAASNRRLQIAKPGKRRQTRKRKGELEAPACRPDCQVNHTIEQTAAILQVSTWQVRHLIKNEKLAVINAGTGEINKTLRVPHPSIHRLQRNGNSG